MECKTMNIKTLGCFAVLTVVLLVVAAIITLVVGPLLVSIGLLHTGLTLTDTLLLLILVRLVSKA